MQSQNLESGVWYDPNQKSITEKDDYVEFNPYTNSRKTKIIDKVLSIAGNHNGKVFGGYVRDVIVPRLDNPTAKVYFNDVDIWFTNQKDADLFIDNTRSCLTFLDKRFDFDNSRPGSNIKPGMMHYTFGRVQYQLYKADKFISFFDVVVSETIPVDDFDVNCLNYQYTDKGKIVRYCSNNTDTVVIEEIIQKIKNKTAFMLSSYVPKMYTKTSYGIIDYLYFVNRLNKKYLSRGWTIYCLNMHKFPLTISEEWIKKVLQPTAKLYLTCKSS